MRKITIILTMIMMVMTTVAFGGCGSSEPKTLEDYLANNEEAQQEIENAINAEGNEEMTVDVAYEGNNITITNTLKQTYDEETFEAVSKAFEEQAGAVEKNAKESIAQIEESTGITGVTMDITVRNGDGKEIWKGHYTNG